MADNQEMLIQNASRKTSIRAPFERADTVNSRFRGLMFRKAPLAILFSFDWTDCHSIHSLFVPFDFDAVYLDEQMKVTEVFSRIHPFIPLLTPTIPARHLLELPPGEAEKLKLQKGDLVKIGR